ncbi:MAG: hypothetical protein GYB31_10510 [Bacteroidetes bacterium]|nr:hypothetical protein [Bacteroidota bacterium]
MTAQYSDTKAFDPTVGDLFEDCLAALKECGFKIKETDYDTGLIKARSAINLWSWSEKIEVQIYQGGEVTATSKCLVPTQMTSWGRNKQNVERFFRQLMHSDIV